jgi:pyridoxamine 5'-phosphate oxidase
MKDFFDALKNDHSEFGQNKLEEHFGNEPWELFSLWYKEAYDAEKEPNAMTLSTVDREGQPSSRILYLKELLDKSFIFYTNYTSDKARDIAENNKVALLFFWPINERQIRIEGTASKVDGKSCDDYFASRPRGSQIGAWASDQSSNLISRDALDQRIAEFEKEFPDIVPRPSNWGGYAVLPTKIEFWQGRPSRLHDRIVYEKKGDSWIIYRLNP